MISQEWKRILVGQPYRSADAELVSLRHRAKRLLAQYCGTDPADADMRYILLKELLGKIGNSVEIEPPFFCDYGSNIQLGENFYANFNCVILDPAEVTIGNNVFLGPNVQIYTAYHPLNPEERI